MTFLEIRQMQALALHDLCSTPPPLSVFSQGRASATPTVLQKAQGPATTLGRTRTGRCCPCRKDSHPPELRAWCGARASCQVLSGS